MKEKTTHNLIIGGNEWRQIRKNERSAFKARMIRTLEAQKYSEEDAESNPLFKESNDTIDLAIKCVVSQR